MRQRQLASVNLNNADQERSKERTRSQNPKAQKKCQPPSSEVWQENEKAHSKARTRSERPGDLEDPFIVMGRLMRNAWRRVSSPQMSPGGISALGGNDGGPDCDAPKEIISEEEPEMERRPQYNHIKSESTHMIEGEVWAYSAMHRLVMLRLSNSRSPIPILGPREQNGTNAISTVE